MTKNVDHGLNPIKHPWRDPRQSFKGSLEHLQIQKIPAFAERIFELFYCWRTLSTLCLRMVELDSYVKSLGQMLRPF